MPDLDTFSVLPWDTTAARVFCRLYEPDHVRDVAGQAYYGDSRGLLLRTHAAFTERTGLEMRTGTEPEMSWEGPGLEALPVPEPARRTTSSTWRRRARSTRR